MSAPLHAHNQTAWSEFLAELDTWAASGRRAEFWWRDDDATKPGPALDRLIAITGANPLALAVIPASATAELASVTRDYPNIDVVQHGFAHTNHAPIGEKKAEFGAHRPIQVMRNEILEGRKRLTELFGATFTAVFVPPWNRIASSVAAALEACEFSRLSTFGSTDPNAIPKQINCHIDIVNWRGGRGFLGVEPVLDAFTALLSGIRTGALPVELPVGLLTHHRDHDDAGWLFLEELAPVLADHPGVNWLPVVPEKGAR